MDKFNRQNELHDEKENGLYLAFLIVLAVFIFAIMVSVVVVKAQSIEEPEEFVIPPIKVEVVDTSTPIDIYEPEIEEVAPEPITETEEITTEEPVPELEPVIIPEFTLTEEEIDLIALVTFAEAEGEPEYGKRLVIDTILNRVESKHFPDTVSGVIYQQNQFSSMWNGRVNRSYVTDEIRQLVKEEMVSRVNKDVIFFTAGKYGAYGKRMFSVGNHYFASYK